MTSAFPRCPTAACRNSPGLAQLRSLRLANLTIQYSGLESLVGLRQLTELDLNSTGITDLALIPLSKMTSLEKLVVSNTNLSNSGLERLASSTQAFRA